MKKIFTILGIATFAGMNAQIVINEAYGGGGNNGATYKNDFVELINRGTSTVTLTGAYLQYGSAANAMSQYHSLPNITLAPGQTYLIQEAVGAAGTTALPSPDYIAPVPLNLSGTGTNTVAGFNMAGTGFKLALTTNNIAVTSATDSNVLDFVGAGPSASLYEGAGPTPAPSNTTSITRTNGIDTNNNKADFTTATPTPTPSTGALAVSDINISKNTFVKNTLVSDEVAFGAKSNDVKVFNMNSQVVKAAAVSENRNLNVADLNPGMYIITGTVNGKPVSQKIIKK